MVKKKTIENARFNEKIRKRRNRRKMAWLSLFSMLGIVLLMMFFVSVDRIRELSAIVDTLFFCLASIVLGYLGIATYDDLNIMKHDKKDDDK